MVNNNRIGYLHFWCQKVLPLVYSDSLSYLEVLYKMKEKLNEVIKYTNDIPDYIDKKLLEALDEEHLKELISEVFRTIEDAISANNEGTNTHFSTDYKVGDLVWHDNKLYEVTREIDAGDTVLVDVNIELRSFATLFKEFVDTVKHNISENDEGTNTNASTDLPMGTWIWINDKLYIATRDIDAGDAFVYTDHKNVSPLTVENQSEMTYVPNDKKLIIHGKIDDYDAIVEHGDYHVYNPRVEAIEIREV